MPPMSIAKGWSSPWTGSRASIAAPSSCPFATCWRMRSSSDGTGIVIAHNHPSGDPEPSKADIAATRMLVHAARALEIRVLDHLIFTTTRCTSFRALGLL